MKITTKKMKTTLFLASAITLGSIAPLKAANVEGLELLKNIGSHKGELNTYLMQKPSPEALRRVLEISTKMTAAAGVKLAYGKPDEISDTRQQFKGLEDSSALFELDSQNGHFLFNGGMNKYRQDESTKLLPDNKLAPRYAYYMLKKYGLAVDPAQLKLAHVGGLNMAKPDGKGGSTIFEKLKTVRFNRVLDGLPVEGSARILVTLGERASLSGMIYQWSDIAKALPLDQSQMRKPDSIRYQAQKKIEEMSKKARTARLSRASLVLYDDGRGITEPAYHFVVERYMDLGETKPVMIPYDFYISVAENPQAFYPHNEIAQVSPDQGISIEATELGQDE